MSPLILEQQPVKDVEQSLNDFEETQLSEPVLFSREAARDANLRGQPSLLYGHVTQQQIQQQQIQGLDPLVRIQAAARPLRQLNK